MTQLSCEDKIETIVISGSMKFEQEMALLSNKLEIDDTNIIVEIFIYKVRSFLKSS